MSPSITRQRQGESRQGLRVRRRNQWGARRSYTDARSVSAATRLFFHITVTNPRNYNSNDAHARGVEAIGIARFSATGISYNMLVMPDASIYEAQPLGRRGAHTVNDFRRSSCTTSGCANRGRPLTAPSWNLNFNARSVAICQNVNDPVTAAQIDSVARIGAAWKREGFVHSDASWHGHRCVSAKSCPGNLAWRHMSTLQSRTNNYVRNGLGGGTPPPQQPQPPKEEEDDMPPYREWPQADKDALARDIWNMKNTVSGETHSRMLRLAPSRAASRVWNRKNPQTGVSYGAKARTTWQTYVDRGVKSVDGNTWSLPYMVERIWNRLHVSVWGAIREILKLVTPTSTRSSDPVRLMASSNSAEVESGDEDAYVVDSGEVMAEEPDLEESSAEEV